MRVFVFEHVCGGGMVRQPLDSGLARQGAALLSAVVADFLKAGIHVLTTLDHRFDLSLSGAQVLAVGPADRIEPVIDQLAAEADWALVIAPESEGVLEAWSAKLTAAGARRLGSKPDAVALCADKLALSRALAEVGLPIIETRRLDKKPTIDRPMIVKRRRGAAHEDIYVVRRQSDLAGLPFGRDWIIQPFQPGRSINTSFIVHGQQRRRLLACEQCIEWTDRLVYHGGRMPVEEPTQTRAFDLAERALERIGGLHGFVGVDLILADSSAAGGSDAGDSGKSPGGDVIVEVNARPTMAYVGLARLCATSLARALVDSTAPLAWQEASLAFEADGRILWQHAGTGAATEASVQVHGA